ncbi:MAG: TraR/DksA C4-type zinc finger protein [Pirellulaceae bacterium]|nr:TraR/DksA C4-type zinc finger protein [Pirellulaceae bacterium]
MTALPPRVDRTPSLRYDGAIRAGEAAVSGMRLEFRCSHCGRFELGGLDELRRRLQDLRFLKRAEDPAAELLLELSRSAAPRMVCSFCGQRGIEIAPADGSRQDEWEMTRNCSVCGRLIPAERIELLPDVELCVACQRDEESGQTAGQLEYCPRCGSVLQLRSAAQGLSRYVLRCSHCSWRGA